MATELVDDQAARRYRLLADGVEVGFVDYDPVGSVRGRGLTVIPICPYALNYVRRYPEYRDVVRAELRGTL